MPKVDIRAHGFKGSFVGFVDGAVDFGAADREAPAVRSQVRMLEAGGFEMNRLAD